MYLITGATGHLGNTLIRELLQENPQQKIRAFVLPDTDITALAELPVELVYGDVLKPQSIDSAMQGIDTVFHLAGIISIRTGKNELTEKVNIQGTQNVGLAALKAGVRRMVHVASIHVFERIRTGVIDETIALVTKENAAGVYDYTKAEAIRRLRSLIKQGLDVVIACPTGIIGPNDYLGSEMGKVFRQYLTKSTHMLPDGGYDWVDVRDVAHGLRGLAEHGATGQLYILGGHTISIGGFAEHVANVLNKPIKIIQIPYPIMLLMAYVFQFVTQLTGAEPKLTPYSLRTIRDNTNISHQKAVDSIGYSCRAVDETIKDMIVWYS